MGVGVGVAGLIEIKANSASQQSWSWGLAEPGKSIPVSYKWEKRKIIFLIRLRVKLEDNKTTG